MNREQSEPQLPEEQKETFKKMLKDKRISLEEELEKEKQYYEKYGLYNNRDIEEIESQLKIVNNVLKNFDSLPICTKS